MNTTLIFLDCWLRYAPLGEFRARRPVGRRRKWLLRQFAGTWR